MDLAERQILLDEVAKNIISPEQYRAIVHPELEIIEIKTRNAVLESQNHDLTMRYYELKATLDKASE